MFDESMDLTEAITEGALWGLFADDYLSCDQDEKKREPGTIEYPDTPFDHESREGDTYHLNVTDTEIDE